MIEPNHKTCSTCGVAKPVERFEKANKRPAGITSRCRDCATIAQREWCLRNPDRRREHKDKAEAKQRGTAKYKDKCRNSALKSKYKIDIHTYDDMVKSQGGKCAICDRVPKRLFVDHDWSTGKIRELLCPGCNSALGLFREDIAIFHKAMDYVLKHRATATSYVDNIADASLPSTEPPAVTMISDPA